MTGLDGIREKLNPVPEGRCLIGISGGADSVGLMLLLLPLRESAGLEIQAVHVNHGLRGAESDGDEAFVRQMCGELSVPLRTVRLDLGDRRDENSAREARYAAFRQIMEETGTQTLVLAHQREDQAETFLLRLIRGAGPEGLGGMVPREEREGYTLLRPLLNISGGELREALRQAGIPWREDGSNLDPGYLRNRVRRELIPLMEEMNPGAAGRLAPTAELVSLDNQAMDQAACALMKECECAEGLQAGPLAAAPEALACRVLRMWWRQQGPRLEERELNYDQTRRLYGLTGSGRGRIINLPGGWRARREKDCLRLLEPGNRTKNNRPKKDGKERLPG